MKWPHPYKTTVGNVGYSQIYGFVESVQSAARKFYILQNRVRRKIPLVIGAGLRAVAADKKLA